MSINKNLSRSANALLVTLIVLSAVGAMLALSSERMAGTRSLQSTNLARQQAAYAAETVASLVETKLAAISGLPENLTDNITSTSGTILTVGNQWLAQGFYGGENAHKTGMLIGNCLVYWRVEPVKIYSKTIADTNGNGYMDTADQLADKYTNNFKYNPNDQVASSASWTGTSLDETNPGYYHYRITTQAYYINQNEWDKSNINVSTADPWTKPEQTIASSQTQRMVQLKLINLFRYVIFYGAKGVTGDIELITGANISIKGAVHTNGALYLGGKGTAFTTGDYHTAASTGATTISVGKTSASENEATITGVDGIYRTRKNGNIYYQKTVRGALMPSYLDPKNIPINLSGTGNLNGDSGTSTAIKLNQVNITYDNDSRSQPPLANISNFTRDKSRGAEIVNTLASIPELAGYPLESQRIVGPGVFLYETSNGTLTIRPQDFLGDAEKLYYADNTRTVIKRGELNKTNFPVYATDMPLFEVQRVIGTSTLFVRDVMSSSPNADASVDLGGWIQGDPNSPTTAKGDTFLPHSDPAVLRKEPKDQYNAGASFAFESRGYYLQQSLFGKTGGLTTGLTIRERGAQNTAFKLGVANPPTTIPTSLTYPIAADLSYAMSVYMASNYVVYFGIMNGAPVDITETFFGLRDAAGNPQDGYANVALLPAVEENFMNRREAHCNSVDSQRNGIMTIATATNYTVNVISLNVQNIQSMIKGTAYQNQFNGLIYVHRTPRLGYTGGIPIYDPLMPLRYHPLVQGSKIALSGLGAANPIYSYNTGYYPIVGNVSTGEVDLDNSLMFPIGAPNVWVVYPSRKQVLVRNGSTIDWGGVQQSGRLQGLTIVTPNQCYIKGDYNTLANAGKLPPCAIFADGLTALTNSWVGSATYTSSPSGNSTTYNLSVVLNNVPSDYQNSWDEGSGGTTNCIRFLERGARSFTFMGSLVVLNRMRYSYNYLGSAAGWYGAPTRNYNFNPDLLTSEGQPPYSPGGIQVTRVVSSINLATP